MKVIQQYGPVVLFIMLYKVNKYIVLNEVFRTSESVDEILKQFFSCGIVYCAVQGDSNF